MGRKLETFLKTINKKYYAVFSFLLSSLAMYLFLGYSQVLSTGKYCLLWGDLIEIYVPAVRQLVRDLLQGESIYYSFSNSLGMNTAAYNASYATGSVFNVWYLLLYRADPSFVTALVVILKAGTVGASFHIFYQNVFKESSVRVVAFSLLYAMCSYDVYMNTVNIIWMDALYILPLLALLLLRFVKFGKWKLLVLLYAYLFFYNYYMGYMIGIVSFVFFLTCLFAYGRKGRRGKMFWNYCLCVLLSALMAAAVLLPAAAFLLEHRAEDSTSLVWTGCNLLDVYNQLFLGEFNGSEGRYPYIYCGIPVLLLVPCYFLCKRIGRKEKIVVAVPLAVLLLCCIMPAGYLLLHAFDAPDGWGFRFSYMISFGLCVLGCRAAAFVKEISQKRLVFVAGISMLAYVAAMYFQRSKGDGLAYTSNSWLFAGVNALVISVWILYAFWYKKYSCDRRFGSALIGLGLLLVVSETVFNGYLSYYKEEDLYPEMMEDTYFAWRDNLTDALETVEESEEDAFYRIATVYDEVINSDTYMGYNGVADFATTENYWTRKALEKLGFYSSPRYMPSYGLNPVTAMLLDVKYEISVLNPYYQQMVKEQPDITENSCCLSLGFLVDASLQDFTFGGDDVFKNANELLSAMTGDEIAVFSGADEVEIIEDGISLREGAGQLVLDGDSAEGERTITYRIPSDERVAYSQFSYGDSLSITGMPLFEGGEENTISYEGKFGVSYCRQMDQDEQGYYVTIGMWEDSIQSVYYEQANFYYYNSDELEKAYEKLSQNELALETVEDGYLKGSIATEASGQLLFLSVPYDKGWKVYVDGEEVELQPVLEDGFMALPVADAGEHEIVLEYHAPGLRLGILLSAAAWLAFAAVGFRKNRNRRAGREKAAGSAGYQAAQN